MKILVIGASGLIGKHCYDEAKARGHETIGTYRSRIVEGMQQLNTVDLDATVDLIYEIKPDAVIYCAGWSYVDGCEEIENQAYRQNRNIPTEVAALTQTHFLYFSTSYVFDGRKQFPYTEEDRTSPLSHYGKSKAQAEISIQLCARHRSTIVRTMGVYGPEWGRKNFAYQVVDRLTARNHLKVPVDQTGNATSADDIAYASLDLIQRRATGVWHVAGPNPGLNRYELAKAIAEKCELDASLIDPVTTSELKQAAPRPLNAGLDIKKATKYLGWEPKDIDQIQWTEYLK